MNNINTQKNLLDKLPKDVLEMIANRLDSKTFMEFVRAYPRLDSSDVWQRKCQKDFSAYFCVYNITKPEIQYELYISFNYMIFL